MVSIGVALEPVVRRLVGHDSALQIRFWDGSEIGPPSPAAVVVRSPKALRWIMWSPGELGLARAYVAGDLDIDGDIYAVLASRDSVVAPEDEYELSVGWRGWWTVAKAALRVGALGLPLRPPQEEVRLGGLLHTRRRDAAAISHHYDIGNDFYSLVLGESMTYSCGYFTAPDTTLEEAQAAKHDMTCRKLALSPGMRLLDIGCGWGGMVLHAATHYGVEAVGITLSSEQAELARRRAANAGLADRVEIRMQDYRDVPDGPFDAISSIGMVEHVGLARLAEYFTSVRSLLRPQGRLLNHAISLPAGVGELPARSFPARYVFPDGQLHEVGRVISTMQDLGLEVRHVESLREHYPRTLRAWVTNLEDSWDEAVDLVGAARARVWRLYMAASALNFEANRTSIHQVLAVKPDQRGTSGMRATPTW